MTTPEPTDEEPITVDRYTFTPYAAGAGPYVKITRANERGGVDDVACLPIGALMLWCAYRRCMNPPEQALFTAGERHMLERAIDKLKAKRAKLSNNDSRETGLICALFHLDSLRAPGSPPKEPDESFEVWRCSSCGEMKERLPDTAWRWTGVAWEHKCGDPQAGYFPARSFGSVSAAIKPTLESLRAPGETAKLECSKCGATVNEDFEPGRCLPGVHGVEADEHAEAEPSRGGEPAIVERLATLLSRVGHSEMLNAPCIFCGYDGRGYWQARTHGGDCPWHSVGSYTERASALAGLVASRIDRPTPAASVPSERERERWRELLRHADEAFKEHELEAEQKDRELALVHAENDEAQSEVTRLTELAAKERVEHEATLDAKHAQLVEVADKLREERARVERALGALRLARRGAGTASSQGDAVLMRRLLADGVSLAIESLEPTQPPRASIPKIPDAPDTRHGVMGAIADSLPTNAEDERIVDELMAKRAAGLAKRAMPKGDDGAENCKRCGGTQLIESPEDACAFDHCPDCTPGTCAGCGHEFHGRGTCGQPSPGADTTRAHYVCACTGKKRETTTGPAGSADDATREGALKGPGSTGPQRSNSAQPAEVGRPNENGEAQGRRLYDIDKLLNYERYDYAGRAREPLKLLVEYLREERILLHPPQPPEQSPEPRSAKKPDEQR